MSILVLNAGSSTLKFALFEAASLGDRADGVIDWKKDPTQATLTMRQGSGESVSHQAPLADYRAAVDYVLGLLADATAADPITACGHRVVHGGRRLHESTVVDAEVKKALAEACELAPLHNPPALEGIAAAEAALPGLPHVVVFDTEFFRTLTPARFLYAVPQAWHTDWGVRRFGFHGISHAYCAGRAAELLAARGTGG